LTFFRTRRKISEVTEMSLPLVPLGEGGAVKRPRNKLLKAPWPFLKEPQVCRAMVSAGAGVGCK